MVSLKADYDLGPYDYLEPTLLYYRDRLERFYVGSRIGRTAGYVIRNVTALQMLDAVRRAIVNDS